LACLLHRSRLDETLPEIKLDVGQRSMTITLPVAWLESHALTVADLEQEKIYLNEHGFELSIESDQA
jgi:exopolyphosphatase/guanosine-5'-triphosphate,3'-diphosphate pyrophosphatase